MSEIVKKPVGITETVLRDSHQSLIATRMPTELMLPILETMDKVGYHSLEELQDKLNITDEAKFTEINRLLPKQKCYIIDEY